MQKSEMSFDFVILTVVTFTLSIVAVAMSVRKFIVFSFNFILFYVNGFISTKLRSSLFFTGKIIN